MADFIDRISGASEPARPRIPIHYFIGLERLYALGVWSRLQIATALDLQGAEATQAAQIANNIDAATGATNKMTYVSRVEAVLIAVQSDIDTFYHSAGAVNKNQVYTDLQIAG